MGLCHLAPAFRRVTTRKRASAEDWSPTRAAGTLFGAKMPSTDPHAALIRLRDVTSMKGRERRALWEGPFFFDSSTGMVCLSIPSSRGDDSSRTLCRCVTLTAQGSGSRPSHLGYTAASACRCPQSRLHESQPEPLSGLSSVTASCTCSSQDALRLGIRDYVASKGA